MKSKIIVILGPSAAGKTRIQKKLNLTKIVTTTTRSIRNGEKNGVDYFFVDEGDFKHYIENDKLIEWTTYSGAYYGIERQVIEKALACENDLSLILDKNGAAAVKALWPSQVVILGIYASKAQIKQRLIDRHETEIASRLAQYEEEVQSMLALSDLLYHSNTEREADVTALIENGLGLMLKTEDF